MSRLSSFLFFGIGALVGGALGGATAVLLLPQAGAESRIPSAEKQPSKSSKRSSNSDSGDLQRRMDSLERRVSLLTFAQAHSSPTKPSGEDVADDAPEGEPIKAIDDPVFEVAVRDVVDRLEFEKETQRDVERSERNRARTDRWVQSVSDDLKLSDEQRAKIAEVVTQYFQSLRDLRDSDSPDRPLLRSEWRERMRTVRTEAEAKLKAGLSSEQAAKFDTLEQGELLGGFGRRGGGRGAGNNDSPRRAPPE